MAEEAVVWHDVSVDVGWGVLRGKTCIVGGPYEAGEGLKLVGLHGWLDNCNSFDALIPLLPQKVKVLVLDLPGHGLSDHLPLGAHYNPFVYALNIRTAVLKLGWKKFVLMGHSMGAAVSNVFTALFPEHVKALICLDFIFPMVMTGFVERCRTYAFDLLKAEQLALQPPLVYSEREAIDRLVAARVFGYQDESTVDREAAQTLLPRSTRQVDDGYVWSHDRKAKANFLVFLVGKNWIETISAIKCPFLLIRATRGTGMIRDEDFKKVLASYESNAQWVQSGMVEGSHHVHMTEPELVAPMVTDFLEKVGKESQFLRAKL